MRLERGALRDGARAQHVAFRIFDRAGIEMRSANAAKDLAALVAALGRLDVALWCTALEHKMRRGRRDVRTKGRAADHLTVGAMAQAQRVGIDLSFVGDLTAVATPVDLHALFPWQGGLAQSGNPETA